jgi:hypothetical protein
MMGERAGAQEALFYGFSLEGHVPQGHMLRSIDRFVDLGDTFDQEQDRYICPGDKILKPRHRNFATPRSNVDANGFIRYRATKLDCDACAMIRCGFLIGAVWRMRLRRSLLRRSRARAS